MFLKDSVPFISPNLIALIILLTSGCFSVSDHEQLLSSAGEIRTDNPDCPDSTVLIETSDALDKQGFTLVSWNIYKENKADWQQDLLALSIILLQEAYLTDALDQLLKTSGRQGIFHRLQYAQKDRLSQSHFYPNPL